MNRDIICGLLAKPSDSNCLGKVWKTTFLTSQPHFQFCQHVFFSTETPGQIWIQKVSLQMQIPPLQTWSVLRLSCPSSLYSLFDESQSAACKANSMQSMPYMDQDQSAKETGATESCCHNLLNGQSVCPAVRAPYQSGYSLAVVSYLTMSFPWAAKKPKSSSCFRHFCLSFSRFLVFPPLHSLW